MDKVCLWWQGRGGCRSRLQNKMVAIRPGRGNMELFYVCVTILLLGAVGAEYNHKIYIDESCNPKDEVSTDGHLAGEILLSRGKGCTKCNCSFTLTHNDTNMRLKVRFQNLNLGEDKNMQCLGTIKISSVLTDGKKQPITSAMCKDPTTIGSTAAGAMNALFFEVILGQKYDNPKASMFYTVFHEGDCDKEDEFECGNTQCVSNKLKCDGYDNCGDKSDEDKDMAKCGATGMTSSTSILSLVSLAGIWVMKFM